MLRDCPLVLATGPADASVARVTAGMGREGRILTVGHGAWGGCGEWGVGRGERQGAVGPRGRGGGGREGGSKAMRVGSFGRMLKVVRCVISIYLSIEGEGGREGGTERGRGVCVRERERESE